MSNRNQHERMIGREQPPGQGQSPARRRHLLTVRARLHRASRPAPGFSFALLGSVSASAPALSDAGATLGGGSTAGFAASGGRAE